MNPAAPPALKPFQFSPAINKSLNAYALSATAAGVAMLALNPSATAEVVYTPISQKIASNTTFALDLNHDGVVDFRLINSDASVHYLSVAPGIAGNGVWQGHNGRFSELRAAALPLGRTVHSRAPFVDKKITMAYATGTAFTSQSTGGPWKDARNRFLGLKFLINDEVHYGWARFNVVEDRHNETVYAEITGYAYETVANQPIKTGQTRGTVEDASNAVPQSPQPQLGMLALGSPGLSAWRRDP
jgi:hypothetical protein